MLDGDRRRVYHQGHNVSGQVAGLSGPIEPGKKFGLRGSVVIADAAYGTVSEFRRSLEERQLHYLVGVAPELTVWTKPGIASSLPYAGSSRPST